MPAPRCIVLTNAPDGELPREYLTDLSRFPGEPAFTSDLAKARTWLKPPGVARYKKRNRDKLPALASCRRIWVNLDIVEAARKRDAAAALPPAPTDAKPTPTPRKSRRAKHPNKRPAKRARPAARRTAAKRSGKRTARHLARRKVAA